MADRRSLLNTGKDVGSSIAGTFKSVAGTVAEKGKQAASRSRSGVRKQFKDLTDETVTDQDQARLERARQEALQEARQEARDEFQEEFRENVADEAFDAELQRLRRQTGINPMADEGSTPESTQQAQTRSQSGFGAMGLFGPSPAQQRAQRAQQPTQRQPQQRGQAVKEQNPREAQFQNTMAFGGFADPADGRTQDPPPQVEQLFGVSSRGRDEAEQIAPLFGLRY